MYIGRFVVVGPSVGAYRVSSRSFPNRRIVRRGGGPGDGDADGDDDGDGDGGGDGTDGATGTDTLTVVPTEDAAETDNPYVSYNCARRVRGGAGAVVGNGSHVDPVAEKYDRGYPARDALVEALHALDYEKDDYDTPRVAGVVEADAGYVGIVRRDALLVRAVEEPHLVATYEEADPRPFEFDARTAVAAARTVYELPYEHAVCAAGVHVGEEGVGFAVENGENAPE